MTISSGKSNEQRAQRAAYMREYNARPEIREKKNERDRKYYQDNPENLKRNQERAKQHYWDHRDEKRKYIADRFRDAKIKAIEQLGGKCAHCGWMGHPAAMQFHHIDPVSKLFNVTTNVLTSPKKYPREIIDAELAKCVLLCANCHFIHHSAWEIEE